MTIVLDQELLYKTKRRRRDDGLTDNEVVAVNLLWRKKVRVSILAAVFGTSKNTIYYRCLTGRAKSYPDSTYSNKATDTNALIDSMGEAVAWDKYMTDEIVQRVNKEMAEELRRRGVEP